MPMYSEDSRDLVLKILHTAEQKGEEVPIQDGFDLYKELVDIRRLHGEVLPGYEHLDPSLETPY